VPAHRALLLQHHRAAQAISQVRGQTVGTMIIPAARFHVTFKLLKRDTAEPTSTYFADAFSKARKENHPKRTVHASRVRVE
jgi:hypothetical protein